MTDDELDALLGALPYFTPKPGLPDGVIAQVAIQQRPKRRWSPAAIAVVAVAVVGAMAASAIWSLGHREIMASLGQWLLVQAGEWAWGGVQSGYAIVHSLSKSLVALAAAWIVASLVSLGGLVALRRLIALPTGQVAHVRS